MCVKSVEGEGSRGVGQLLTELEEKMEVILILWLLQNFLKIDNIDWAMKLRISWSL